MSEPQGDLGTTPRRFLVSSLASYWSLGVRLLVTFASRMILARLLLPEDHGLYDLALRIVIIASALRDLGLVHHLIRDERRPYGTVFRFVVPSSVLVTLALVLGAPLAGRLDPGLPGVLAALAPWVLLDGLAAVPKTWFERELRIDRLMGPEIARGLLMAAIAIALAWTGWGVWSFVAAELLAAAVYTAWVWWRARGGLPLLYEPGLLPDLLRRSRGLLLIWVLYQLVTWCDLFVVKAFEDIATVGFYARAQYLAFLVRQVVFPRALLPALVRYRNDRARFSAAFRVTTIFLLSCEVVSGYFLFFNAEQVVRLVLGPGWEPAVVLLRILCLVPFLDAFSELGGEVLKVRHEDRLWNATMALNLVSLLAFGIAFTSVWGAAGMAAASFLRLGTAVMAWRMATIFRGTFARLLGDMAVIYLVPLPLFGLAALLPLDDWWRLAAGAVALLAAFGLLAWKFWRPFRAFLQDRPLAPTPAEAAELGAQPGL